ncbi:DUF475 domain-containing protein [Streptomyces sp. BP-8]|uniref:DUF475 domain-containing protein n=1 Tax=Streptomyces sirii TaxID=3127701 RepID=A0ABZ2QUL4_9ACTN
MVGRLRGDRVRRIRSPTAYLVCQGTLDHYVCLVHSAHDAIGALRVIRMATFQQEIQRSDHRPRGRLLIAWCFGSSVRRNRAPAITEIETAGASQELPRGLDSRPSERYDAPPESASNEREDVSRPPSRSRGRARSSPAYRCAKPQVRHVARASDTLHVADFGKQVEHARPRQGNPEEPAAQPCFSARSRMTTHST